METGQLLLAILGTGSIAAVAGAMVNGLFSRRKLGADATEIITRAASGVVERIEGENERLRKEADDMRGLVGRMERLLEEHTRTLQLHASWDSMAVAKLAEHGIHDLPTPPPLYSPTGSPSRMRATLEGTEPE